MVLSCMMNFVIFVYQSILLYLNVFKQKYTAIFKQFENSEVCPLVTIGEEVAEFFVHQEQKLFSKSRAANTIPQNETETESIEQPKFKHNKSRGIFQNSGQCRRQPLRIEQAGEKFALLLGGDVTLNLAGAVNEDLKRVFEVLVKEYGIDPKNIFILTQLNQSFVQWRVQQKTIGDQIYLKPMNRANLVQALTDMKNRIKKVSGKSYLHIHYSGHGVQVKDMDGDEIDGMDEAITCEATKVFTDDEFSSLLFEQLPQNNCTVFFMDQCHSGSFGDLTYMYNPKSKKFEVCVKKQKNHIATIYAISGCTDTQLNYQGYYTNGKDGGLLSVLFAEGVSKHSGVPFRYMLDNLPQMIEEMNSSITGQVMQLTSSKQF